ncbi:MAG: hypothetical protein KR126chlam1_00230 [Chlamydiae bacterium]|nr:hypothetical protein [Chlamydiota bacterium]
MNRPRSFFRRKGFLFLICALALFGVLFTSRYKICALGAKFVLSRSFGSRLTYERIHAKRGIIDIRGLRIREDRYQLMLNQAELSIDLNHLLRHPSQIVDMFRIHREKNFIEKLSPLKGGGLSLSIDNGQLQLGKHRYYFIFEPGSRSQDLGLLSISQDPGLSHHPFLLLRLTDRGEELIFQMNTEQVASDRFLHLASFLFPEQLDGFKRADGHIECKGSAIYDWNGGLTEMALRFALDHFEMRHPEMQFAVRLDHAEGDFSYPEGVENAGLPIWKKILGSFSLENGELACGENLLLTRLNGNVELDPREAPNLSVTGDLAGEEHPLALQLVGKGSLHDDQADWLELGLNLDDQFGTQCEAFLSVSRPEKDALILQLEASQLLPGQVEMLKKYLARSLPRLHDWEVQKGTFGGKLVVLFENGGLSSFEIQDVLGEEVVLKNHSEGAPLYFAQLEAQGRLKGWNPEAIGELTVKADLPLCHLLRWPAAALSDAYAAFRPSDGASLAMTIHFEQGGVQTRGSVDMPLLEESLQFGWKAPRAFPASLNEIEEGWARSEKLSYPFYGPFVRLISEDLELYGDVDLLATYNGSEVEFALQVEQFLAKHPLLDLQASAIGEKEKTAGRIRVHYHPLTHAIAGEIPLRGGKAYERKYGLYFQEVDADLVFAYHKEKGTFQGVVTDGRVTYDEHPLLSKTAFTFSIDERHRVLLTEGNASLVLPTDREFQIAIKEGSFTSEKSTLSFQLLDEMEEFASFTGEKEEDWKGNLSIRTPSLKGEVGLSLAFDPISGEISLEANGNEIEWQNNKLSTTSLAMKKLGRQFTIEQLKFDETLFKGIFAAEGKGFVFSELSLERPDLSAKGKGTFWIDLPSSSQCFGIRSDLDLKVELQDPLALEIETKHPLKLAYSPSLGLSLSGVELTSGSSTVKVEFFERLFPSGNLEAKGCQFQIEDTLVDHLILGGVFPPLMRDFRFCQNLEGEGHYSSINGRELFDATLKGGARWKEEGDRDLGLQLIREEENCSVTFKEEGESEGLTIAGIWSDEGFTIERATGELGRLSADLKVNKDNALKGRLNLDFSLFSELFDLPVNSYLTQWRAGSGYQFDGVFHTSDKLADWRFQGKVRGEGFDCAGYQFRSLEAKIEALQGQIAIENLDLTDDAGKMWMGDGSLQRGEDGVWRFHFPLLEIRSFQPSFLHRLVGQETAITPLVIKSATVQELRGSLTDPSTITGYGSLRFVNRSKDGETLLPKNLPTEALTRLGLDGTLFVPASGEMNFLFQAGRLYINEMRNVQSEGGRSRFQFPRTSAVGYLDFQGNLFFNIEVHQNVVSSIRGPLSLFVRGTWDNPELQIR